MVDPNGVFPIKKWSTLICSPNINVEGLEQYFATKCWQPSYMFQSSGKSCASIRMEPRGPFVFARIVARNCMLPLTLDRVMIIGIGSACRIPSKGKPNKANETYKDYGKSSDM